IDLYYREYAKSGDVIDRGFAPEYLKKMITVSVSVPPSEPSEIRQLVDAMGGDGVAQAPTAPGRSRWQRWAARIPEWWARFVLAFLAVALATVFVGGVLLPRPAGLPTRAETTQAASTPTEASSETIDISRLAPFPDRESPWWSWLPVTLLAGLAGLAAYRLSRRELIEPRYLREPEDSERFQEAIKRCTDLLPVNPRDAIRTVNLMRMEYLVQAAEA